MTQRGEAAHLERGAPANEPDMCPCGSAMRRNCFCPFPVAKCTCGPGAWGTCDDCGDDAWCNHYCDFPCDDVTCENRMVCAGCLTGRPCPVHNDTEGDDW